MVPLRQGNLDGTCGLYAVVNAVRMAMVPFCKLTRPDCISLYTALVRVVETDLQGMASVVREGLDPGELKILLGAADLWLMTERDVRLSWCKPVRQENSVALSEALQHLHAHALTGDPAILCLIDGEGHWTVLRKVTAKSLLLLDSGGWSQLSSARLQLPSSSGWKLDLEETFLLTCDLDKRT